MLISLFSEAYSQNNELILRANQLFSIDAIEEVFPADTMLTITPTEKDNFSQLALDFSYLRKWKNLKWLIRVGFDRVTSDGSLILSRSMGYSLSQEDRNRYTFRIGTGIYYPAPFESDKLSLSFTCVTVLDYRYSHENNFKADFFDEQDNYVSGYERNITYPDSWRLRLETGLAFYYYFLGNLGFGCELSTFLYYDKMNGSTYDDLRFFDENGGVAEKSSSEHRENRNLLGLSTAFSMGVTYRF